MIKQRHKVPKSVVIQKCPETKGMKTPQFLKTTVALLQGLFFPLYVLPMVRLVC